MNYQNVARSSGGILFSFKKKGNSSIHYNMNESWGPLLNEISQSHTQRHTHTQILQDFTSMRFLFSCPVVSDSVTAWTAACQASLPSPSPKVYPSSWPLHQWCHPATSSSDTLLLLLPSVFASSRDFPKELCLHQMRKTLELQVQHQSFRGIFRVDLL